MKILSLICCLLLSQSLFCQGFDQGNNYGIMLSDPVSKDLDGDMLDDVAGVRYSYSGVNAIVVATQIAGTDVNFTETVLSLSFEPTGKIDIADIDADGDMDIIVPESGSLNIYLLRNDGTANFTTENLGISGSHKLKFIDIDSDTNLDIAGVNTNSATLTTYLNDGSGAFSLNKEFDSSDDMQFIDIADMDNDGDEDIIITFEEFTGDQIILFENTGSTNFTEKVIGTSRFKSLNDVTVADLNGDGFMDVFGVSNLSSEALLSNGDGTYENFEMPEPGGNLLAVEIADFTGEGRNDYIISNSDGIFWFKNISQQPLVYAQFDAGSISPNFSFAKTDLSNDGDIDLIITNGDMWWLENVMMQEPDATFSLDENTIKVFPNPFSEFLYLETESTNELTMEIVDINGKSMIKTTHLDQPLNVANLVSGSYIITITNEEGTQSKSNIFIKE